MDRKLNLAHEAEKQKSNEKNWNQKPDMRRRTGAREKSTESVSRTGEGACGGED